ncbi:uncharacterized protein LOC135160294 isoform X2 [Diachasmimorpha longicaudata]|uniref:uncharacterized protein LOC135160294 isoform X2 n=1 Tax=Diachasmimorpha longicaudata TaxID=58733 RepID=UPI0030B914B7
MKNIKTSNGKETLERFGDQGGFFDVVLKPMFQQGHEGELLSWLKETSLIRSSFNCPQPECQARSMTWVGARLRDRYNWVCPNCSKKQTIREGCFFNGVKTDFKSALMLVLAWCQDVPYEIAAQHLEIKEHIVKKVYEKCGKVCEYYVDSHPDEFQVGGPGMVLIVDEFPGGYMVPEGMDVTTTKKRNNNSHTILCIAEANCIPPKMWLHMIQAMPEPLPKAAKEKKAVQRCGMVEEAIKVITKQVLPGSFLVANRRARCCNYESLQELKQYGVFSVEYLQTFDGLGHQKLLGNLGTIWQNGVDICEEIQESTRSLAQSIISTHLWKQRFGYPSSSSPAFQCMLNHITECYRFT